MCAICLMNPCHPSCPNAPDPEPIHTCVWCKEAIFAGGGYMETPDGIVCEECIREMSILEFMEMIGEKFHIAEKEEF